MLSDATQNCAGLEVLNACSASNSVHHEITGNLGLAPLVATSTRSVTNPLNMWPGARIQLSRSLNCFLLRGFYRARPFRTFPSHRVAALRAPFNIDLLVRHFLLRMVPKGIVERDIARHVVSIEAAKEDRIAPSARGIAGSSVIVRTGWHGCSPFPNRRGSAVHFRVSTKSKTGSLDRA